MRQTEREAVQGEGKEAVREKGREGTWNRQPGHCSPGPDTEGPWAWVALPKHTEAPGGGGWAQERGMWPAWEGPPQPPPPCSQPGPAHTRPPSWANTRAHTHVHTHTLTSCSLLHTDPRPPRPLEPGTTCCQDGMHRPRHMGTYLGPCPL